MVDAETMQYAQYLSLSRLYLGSEVDYERPIELTDCYRQLRNSLRNASNLDKRLEDPEYMKPVRNKFKVPKPDAEAKNVAKLSAFNADKKMAGVQLLVDGMKQKMKYPQPKSQNADGK